MENFNPGLEDFNPGLENFNPGNLSLWKLLTRVWKIQTRVWEILTWRILTSYLGLDFIDLGQVNEGGRAEPEVRTMHSTPP